MINHTISLPAYFIRAVCDLRALNKARPVVSNYLFFFTRNGEQYVAYTNSHVFIALRVGILDDGNPLHSHQISIDTVLRDTKQSVSIYREHLVSMSSITLRDLEAYMTTIREGASPPSTGFYKVAFDPSYFMCVEKLAKHLSIQPTRHVWDLHGEPYNGRGARFATSYNAVCGLHVLIGLRIA